MILTGKCKESFFGRSMYTEETFDLTQELFQHALIIDFFDSVGIYVSVINTKDLHQISIEDDFRNYHQRDNNFNNRQQATTEAIKKANEIFNSRDND